MLARLNRVPGPTLEGYLYPATYVFPLGGPVDQDANVICLGLERRYQLNFLLDTAASLERLLRLYLVVPEAGRSDGLLYVCELIVDVSVGLYTDRMLAMLTSNTCWLIR